MHPRKSASVDSQAAVPGAAAHGARTIALAAGPHEQRASAALADRHTAVIPDGVYCQSRYSENRLFCPRGIFAWWREVWLEKVPTDAIERPSVSDVEEFAQRAAE